MIDIKFLKKRLEARYYPHKFTVFKLSNYLAYLYLTKSTLCSIYDLSEWTDEEEIIESFKLDIDLLDAVFTKDFSDWLNSFI